MKKVVFLLAALLISYGSLNAQKKNVNLAKIKMGAESPDLIAARDAILLALEDTTTNRLASTWYLAADIMNKIYLGQQRQPKNDKAIMVKASESAFKYYLIADSLDQLPDKKGRIKPKYHTKIMPEVKALQRSFLESGYYYYEQKDYKKTLYYFQKYLDYPSIPMMKSYNLDKDTLRNKIIYYSGIAATLGNLTTEAVKYLEIIKDEFESPGCYAQLCKSYIELKDTANMLRMFKLGFLKFPDDKYYVSNLISYFIEQNKLQEALVWVNESLKKDSKNAVIWNLKGKIIEKDSVEIAKVCYNKAIELDPTFADPLGNIGRIYYNLAVDEVQRINDIKDNKKYLAEKAKLKEKFLIPLPYFEKAYQLNPNEKDYMIALRGIYYNIGNVAKYEQMDKRLLDM